MFGRLGLVAWLCFGVGHSRFIEQAQIQLEAGDFFRCMAPSANSPVSCPPTSNICMCPAGYYGITSRCEESRAWTGVCHPCKRGYWSAPNTTTEDGCQAQACPRNSSGFPACTCDYGFVGHIDWLYCAGEWHGECKSNGQGPLPAPVSTIFSGPSSITNSSSVTFMFKANSENAKYLCTLDGSVSECFAPTVSFEHLGQGQHIFSVRAQNEAGQIEESPPEVSFHVNVSCPEHSYQLSEASDFACSCERGFYSESASDIQFIQGAYRGSCHACEACPRGSQRVGCTSTSAGVCQPCATGMYKQTGVATSYWDTTCEHCESCPIGQYRLGCGHNSSGECVSCESGTYKSVVGNYDTVCDKCTSCDAGFVRTGCSANFPGVCHPCPNQTFKDAAYNWDTTCTACEACDPGFVRQECNSTSGGYCSPCPIHHFKTQGKNGDANAQCTKCEFCPVGSGKYRSQCGGRVGPGTCEHCEECVGVAEDTCMCYV